MITLLPILSTQQVMMSLVGVNMPATDTMPAITVHGLIDLCGEEAMQQIYAGMTERIKTLSITEDSFKLLLQGNFIPDDQFAEMEETLYKLAPQTDATYDSTMKQLGAAEKASPAAIHFYATDFEAKDIIEAFIKDYNRIKPRSQYEFSEKKSPSARSWQTVAAYYNTRSWRKLLSTLNLPLYNALHRERVPQKITVAIHHDYDFRD
jgi:hypothetical protein